jgi:hypothetical protein
MFGFESLHLFFSFKEHRKSSVWMFFIIILYTNHIHKSSSKDTRGNFNDFRKFAVVKLMHIIAHPFTTTEDISILFAVIRQKIFTQVSIKARRAILTASTIILGLIVIIPAGAHITTINQFGGKFFAIIVSFKNTTQPGLITIPVVVGRQNRTISEFKTDARASGDGRCLKSTNVL